ncbi:16S rRNA (guanine(966)-N(2))-methyltransferase RsmD [Streptomyces sp. TRM 70351]|uniref:16S rRNA (guanine(966)-N(2))-methyltransferase RsmD n=1 Tax=Streptomyces sp. TRM 70351 TaxID=3116552 RepID=UPI002E7C09F6|nr:16S rRNA (guanine(966)-N(2))-methyltransferase RsmD [Streptomyces sp. TRM 70351]MEE1931164.1 16S rRNA (guanine(966)-N(2))-methyltransferase RsmD [Streptomyces sp. TRM 70351]
MGGARGGTGRRRPIVGAARHTPVPPDHAWPPFPPVRTPTTMTRVIAGAAGGRRLAVPPGQGTRPTSDRAREGLFSSWEAQLGGWSGLRVLDLYGGSGAVGLEALSRGAAHVLLVEADARAARTIRENVRALRLPGAEVRAARAEQVLAGPGPEEPYDVVFLDPPYAVGDADLREILLTLAGKGWLAAGALVTVERSTRGGEFRWPEGFTALRARRYGEGTLWYGRAARHVTAAS